MKHITKWKLFESQDDEQDEDLIIKKGFKHSVADIEDHLLEITDIGFKIKDGIQQYWDIPSDFVKSSEFRKLTIKDLQKLSKFYNKDLKYFTERYSDMDAIVIEFNYKKWFNKLLKNN